MTAYSVAQLDEIDEITDGREPWRPVRAHFGITSFGVNAWTGDAAGDRIINEHDEEDDAGGALPRPSRPGDVRARRRRGRRAGGHARLRPPGVKRTAFAEEPGTTILALGGTPGKAYEPDGWELWAPVRALYQAGEYAEAADRGREIVTANPEYPMLYYNLACCESLAGRKADAIEHLRAAIERPTASATFAAGDSDFDAIRDDPAFKELVG